MEAQRFWHVRTGHTHFSWDDTRDGVRYVQWPLAYPQERACAPILAPVLP